MGDAVLELRNFFAPELVFGAGAVARCGEYIQVFGTKRPLLITDEGVRRAGCIDAVVASLQQLHIPYNIFQNISENPRDHEVMEGAEEYLRHRCDMLIAIGGGSVLDCAKGIGVVASNKQHILFFEGVNRVPNPMPPLICIPTTAGSGADVSQFAIIVDSSQHKKLAIVSKSIVPDISLIDPDLSLSLPPETTAACGMDALSHAIEAAASNGASPLTEMFALRAVGLIREHIVKAYTEPDNIHARAEMLLGSLFAGIAFSNASLGLLHALSHAVGGYYDLPHGLCNTVLMEPLIRFNLPHALPVYRKIGRELCRETPEPALEELPEKALLEQLLEQFHSLRTKLHLPERFPEIHPEQGDLEELSHRSLEDICIVTNPVMPSEAEIKEIYETVFS